MDSNHDLYSYVPSKAAAGVATGLFAILFALLAFWVARASKGSLRYMWPFLVGLLAEAVGYAMRAVSADNIQSVGLYAGSQVLLILAPVFMAATLYMSYGRLVVAMQSVGEKCSWLKPRWVTKTFVAFDVLGFLLQGTGSGLYTSTGTSPNLAKTILIIGFAVQCIAFGVFLALSAHFHFQVRRKGGVNPGAWSNLLWVLHLSALGIEIRNVFRLIEFAESTTPIRGYLMEREGFFYGLEFAPVFVASLVFAIWPSTRWLNHPDMDQFHGDRLPLDSYSPSQQSHSTIEKGRTYSAV